MPLTITVSQVRDALAAAGDSRPTGAGQPSTAQLGTMFHAVLDELLYPVGEHNLQAALADAERDLPQWQNCLRRHAYAKLLGPKLTSQAASLQGHGAEVLHLWTALQSACDWLAELWWTATQQGERPQNLSSWWSPEETLTREYRQPDWQDSVVVSGRADAVLRIPQRSHWCLLEWKLGQTDPLLDLGQACLYHQLLSEDTLGTGAATASGEMGLVSFHPQRMERLYTGVELREAQARLIRVIGDVAGVGRMTIATATERTAPVAKSPAPSLPAAVMANQLSTPKVEPGIPEMQRKIVAKFKEFGAAVRPFAEPVIGSTFVRYSFLPERGTSFKKVRSKGDDLWIHLQLGQAPFVSVEDGVIVVDVQRTHRETVAYDHVRRLIPQPDPLSGGTHMLVGTSLKGHVVCTDLSNSASPHALVAGTAGRGKTQWLRCAIASLLDTNSPKTLRLSLVDPKQNAFTAIKSSPFLLHEVVTPRSELTADEALDRLIQEMQSRYERFAAAGCDDRQSYIRRTQTVLPLIVCVCDEFNDLIMAGGRKSDAVQPFVRIAQLGRAAGIHLILATQQPSRSTIPGSLMTNLPVRIALRTSSVIESRMLLEDPGAQNLLGHGDLLYKNIGPPTRLQGAYLPDTSFHQLLTPSSAPNSPKRTSK